MIGGVSNSGIKPDRSKLLIVIGAVIIVVLAALAGFFLWQYQKAAANPQAAVNAKAKQDTERILQKVGAIYELPTDETPTVALVQDKEQLNGQAFFARAQNGDYLVLYEKSALALIYRESSNKLINVAPTNAKPNSQ